MAKVKERVKRASKSLELAFGILKGAKPFKRDKDSHDRKW